MWYARAIARSLVAGLVPAVAAGAQPPAPGPSFTLADALAAARTSPLLGAAGGRARAAVGGARQDAAFLNPVVEYRQENLGGPIPRDVFGTVTLGADQYGRRYALRGALGAARARAAADSAAAGRAVVYDVARAYWRAALAVALLDVARAQQAAVDSLAAVQARRAREGAVAEGAALRTRLEADRARLATASARADAERGRGELARALALPVDRVPWPTDGLALGSGPAPAPEAGALVALARRRRPELLAARARLDEGGRRARAERLGALPGVGAVAGYKRTATVNTGVAGVFVALPLFDRNGGARARSEGELLAAENDLRAQEAQVGAEVVSAARAYEALAGAADLRGLDARGRDVEAVTALAYREGAATLLELLDAVRARGDVRAAALRWAADVRLARLDLERAVGGELPGADGAASAAAAR